MGLPHFSICTLKHIVCLNSPLIKEKLLFLSKIPGVERCLVEGRYQGKEIKTVEELLAYIGSSTSKYGLKPKRRK